MTIYTPGQFRALRGGISPDYGANLYRTSLSAINWTTSTTWVPRLTLSIPAGLSGIYKVNWQGIVRVTSTTTEVEARLYDVLTVYGYDLHHHDVTCTDERHFVGGEYSMSMSGAAKLFWIQYRRASGAASVGISNVAIEFKRIA